MPPSDPRTITRLLQGIRGGDVTATETLLPLVYAELGELAARLFSRERREHTLQPTALIHEAWLKLAGNLGGYDDRRHFYAVASQAMRQVLTDHARSLGRQKRGGRNRRVTLDGSVNPSNDENLDLVEFDDLLTRLSAMNARHGRIVELRVLGGLTIPEAAEVLGVSHTTVERDWFMARAWLRIKLDGAR